MARRGWFFCRVTNGDWGVCGFTSSFYAMHQRSPNNHPQLSGAGTATRVLAEIKTYLMMLRVEGEYALLGEIERFTCSFGGRFSTFNIGGYIARINRAVNRTDDEIKDDELYGIAMPPRAVADYLQRIWGVNAQVNRINGGGGGVGGGIIGVSSNDPSMPLYDHLEHYMYRKNGIIYSWGQQFNSVQAAAIGGAGGANWHVSHLITIG